MEILRPYRSSGGTVEMVPRPAAYPHRTERQLIRQTWTGAEWLLSSSLARPGGAFTSFFNPRPRPALRSSLGFLSAATLWLQARDKGKWDGAPSEKTL